jgi:HSP90 family molecular chaperone
MTKEFYTEKDIEELVNRGVHELEINDDILLTVLAYEKARELGLTLHKQGNNDPSVPIRPYLSSISSQTTNINYSTVSHSQRIQSSDQIDLYNRIHIAVKQKLGDQIDSVLLDRIIERVLHSTGVK